MTLIDSMKACELAVSDLYKVFFLNCKPENREFWSMLSSQEINHASLLDKIKDFVTKNQDKVTLGRDLRGAAIALIISGAKATAEEAKNGKILDRNMLFLALDIENSLIESKYFELLKSEESEFTDLMAKIEKETLIHRKMLQEKIAGQK